MTLILMEHVSMNDIFENARVFCARSRLMVHGYLSY